MSRAKNWYVLTGGPSSGKTTLLRELEKLGHATVDEAARAFIDEELAKGKSLDEIRADESVFQEDTFQKKLLLEGHADSNKLTFFDRGTHDTVAYLRFNNDIIEPHIEKAAKESVYNKVFLLDMLPFEADYARNETEEQAHQIHDWLRRTYTDYGQQIHIVPVMPVDERLQFILDRL